jgi:large conductance mechanosensitive channel
MGMIAEFKAFVMRGNVVDMAVGVIIAGAFGSIVTTLVSEILMPPIGWVTGGVSFTDLSIDLPGKMIDPATRDKQSAEQKFIPVKIGYGLFLQRLFDFLIIALCLFFVIKGMNAMKKKDAATAPPEPSSTDKLLMEIRDSLKK